MTVKSRGVWIEVACEHEGCGKKFRYFRKTNVRRKFCEECANIRIAKSKAQFESSKRLMTADAEKSRVEMLLDNIPDYVDYESFFQKVQKGAF